MLGTLERDFVVALTEMMDGQLANTNEEAALPSLMREFVTLGDQVQGKL